MAVDVGGTFTDVCIVDEGSGHLEVRKVPSTADPIDGVFAGVEAAGVELPRVSLFSHGTTVATNALITRTFPPAAVVTTRGFRDILEIRRSNKDELWDAYDDVAPPYIRRRHRLELSERIDAAGRVIQPLDEDEARHIAHVLRRRGVSAVAVCFINSYANPQHEERMRDILKEELPDIHVSISAEVLPEIFEYERFSTTSANTVLGPLVGGYVQRLEDGLRERGYRRDLVLLHSGGGVMTPSMAEKFGVRMAASGIAAGAIAAGHIAARCGLANAIGVDVGGTSTDVSLIQDGKAAMTREWWVQFGHPIRFPSIEVRTIGAGGGSLAWIDSGGSLRSGPASAGADPGPACYGRGNEHPTNTDANLVLGRLGKSLIGGAMELDPAAAERAIGTHIADVLGLSVGEAAEAIISVANANVADAVRLISIQRGYDPRDFALIAFGGAGPLHAAELARELSISTVVVPPSPGITSAMGCLLVDVVHDFAKVFLASTATTSAEELEAHFSALESEAVERLQAEGVDPGDNVLERSVDMRYAGQWRSIAVPVAAPLSGVEALTESFHAMHDQMHGYRRDEAEVEIYRLNLRATGLTPKPEFPAHELHAHDPEPVSRRRVWFGSDGGDLDTGIFDREALTAGAQIEGPAIVEQVDSTIVVPPGTRAEVDEWLNIRMTL